MAYFPDLSNCTYFGDKLTPYLRAVGWIDFNQGYSKGQLSDQRVYDRLLKFRYEGVEYHNRMGPYKCQICQFEWGIRNLFIPGNGYLFVCPEMITHYINIHWYLPPPEFCDAVLACPDMHTTEYKKIFLENGGVLFSDDKHRENFLENPDLLFKDEEEI